MSETKKHREFWIYESRHSRRGVNIIAKEEKSKSLENNHLRLSAIHAIEYQALVEEKQKVKELLSQLELAQGIIHSDFCGTEHHKICTHFEEIFKKYGDV